MCDIPIRDVGEDRVVFDEVLDGEKLFMKRMHVDGSLPGQVGIKQMRDLLREYGKCRGVKQVIVEPARRSTGLSKGKTPRP